MGTKFKSLKEQLRSFEEEGIKGSNISKRSGSKPRKSNVFSGNYRYFLFAAFLISFLIYAGAKYSQVNVQPFTPVQDFFTMVDRPSDQLLEDMGSWMEEMGYTGLTNEELIELREEGVTATYTSRMRDLGYTDLTLDDLVRLRQNDVSSTFAAMMQELGYELSVEDLIRLRQHDVTAYYTSNLHDLGYQDVTMEELIRLKDTGVQTSVVERLVQERETQPTIDELIRYHISNQ